MAMRPQLVDALRNLRHLSVELPQRRLDVVPVVLHVIQSLVHLVLETARLSAAICDSVAPVEYRLRRVLRLRRHDKDEVRLNLLDLVAQLGDAVRIKGSVRAVGELPRQRTLGRREPKWSAATHLQHVVCERVHHVNDALHALVLLVEARGPLLVELGRGFYQPLEAAVPIVLLAFPLLLLPGHERRLKSAVHANSDHFLIALDRLDPCVEVVLADRDRGGDFPSNACARMAS
mmetsp:Transcript_119284/g.337428  ORF Transcript_119284/g.337428 Transcript_119284/m.337428 type:complete len:233 (+) Transcript_119284:368-1066(+)